MQPWCKDKQVWPTNGYVSLYRKVQSLRRKNPAHLFCTRFGSTALPLPDVPRSAATVTARRYAAGHRRACPSTVAARRRALCHRLPSAPRPASTARGHRAANSRRTSSGTPTSSIASPSLAFSASRPNWATTPVTVSTVTVSVVRRSCTRRGHRVPLPQVLVVLLLLLLRCW